jgi:hypothetical protein
VFVSLARELVCGEMITFGMGRRGSGMSMGGGEVKLLCSLMVFV